MLTKSEVVRKYLNELDSLLRSRDGSLVSILGTATRLAQICAHDDEVKIFQKHLQGFPTYRVNQVLQKNEITTTNSESTVMEVPPWISSMLEDRRQNDGNISPLSAHGMESRLQGLDEACEDIKDLEHSEKYDVLRDLKNAYTELSEIRFRILSRVTLYLAKVEFEIINEVSSNQLSVADGGGKVFIGHGKSQLWRDLKDFLQDRLHLKWDEFDRTPAAGLAVKERLQHMLADAKFAFLIMTAEDLHEDTKLHARENVIHEIGLFQGKLGFSKAIILLEDGCKEFSNILGTIQIRFPVGNIEAKFEEIRKVLEREGVLINRAG